MALYEGAKRVILFQRIPMGFSGVPGDLKSVSRKFQGIPEGLRGVLVDLGDISRSFRHLQGLQGSQGRFRRS